MISTRPFALNEALSYFVGRRAITPRPEPISHMATLVEEYRRLVALAQEHIPEEIFQNAGFRDYPHPIDEEHI